MMRSLYSGVSGLKVHQTGMDVIGNNIANVNTYGYKKETILREWVEDTVNLPFDGSALAAPSQYKAYLEAFYGDYMTPPPEDKRYNRHSVTKLDFGEY